MVYNIYRQSSQSNKEIKMNQEKLMKLLKEASKSSCSKKRRMKIQCELLEASPSKGEDGSRKILGRTAGMDILLEKLYEDTLEHNPALLPTFFPVFAIICGDKEKGDFCANINWSLVK